MANDAEDNPDEGAFKWLKEQRDHTDAAIERLRALNATNDLRDVTTEAAIVGTHSNREHAVATILAAETIQNVLSDFSEKMSRVGSALGARIEAATTEATVSADGITTWTRRLVWATWGLAIAAIVAAIIQAIGAIAAAPQIINIPRP